ncbi:translation initiation factor IF-2 subunit alpha [Candidatus Woesearchaeota archaeon]|nr:translation initiation factor IF-2 subunit alpha [Candidatus Woesearchaeota archaeon]
MLLKKQGFPEEGELVLCTVTSVQFHSVQVDLDEYGKSGLIHISEVSPGRIRNIRDFVREGKKVVCKALRINQEKGYIDLSLRRVNESEKTKKIDYIKREQNAEKIVEIAAKKLGIKTEDLYNQISEKVMEKYLSLHEYFEKVVQDDKLLESLGIDSKYLGIVAESIKQRMKPPEVEISGNLKVSLFAPDGIAIIKDSLAKAEQATKGRIKIAYLGSGLYRFTLKAPDYKEAEKLMKGATDTAIGIISKHEGQSEFTRT